MTITWPDFYLPPINLWSAPRMTAYNHVELPPKTGNYCITLASGLCQDAFYDSSDGHWYHPEKDVIIGHGLIVNDFFIIKIV